MAEFVWKLRFALQMRRRAAVPFLQGFDMAGSWVEAEGMDCTPRDAVDEELSCWGDQ